MTETPEPRPNADYDALVARLRALADRWKRSDSRVWEASLGEELADELDEAIRDGFRNPSPMDSAKGSNAPPAGDCR